MTVELASVTDERDPSDIPSTDESPEMKLEVIPRGYYDGYIVKACNDLSEAVHDDWDGLVYVCGREGTGKTTFVEQIAVRLDPSWTIEKMCWTGQKFKDMVLNAKQYDCIVLDEAYMTFAKSQRMQQLNSDIIGMLTMIRKKNLYIIIVAPLFWQMSEYLVVHRCCAMFRIYAHGKMRGFWELYGFERKEKLYYKGKDYKSFHVVPPDRRGRFGKWRVTDKADYEDRKEAAIQELQDNVKKGTPSSVTELNKMIYESRLRFAMQLQRNLIVPRGKTAAMCAVLGISDTTYYKRRLEWDAEGIEYLPPLPPKVMELTSDEQLSERKKSSHDSLVIKSLGKDYDLEE